MVYLLLGGFFCSAYKKICMQKDLYADLYVKIQNVIALFSYIYTLFILLHTKHTKEIRI